MQNLQTENLADSLNILAQVSLHRIFNQRERLNLVHIYMREIGSIGRTYIKQYSGHNQ